MQVRAFTEGVPELWGLKMGQVVIKYSVTRLHLGCVNKNGTDILYHQVKLMGFGICMPPTRDEKLTGRSTLATATSTQVILPTSHG